MDREDFSRQITALRRGELRLERPEANGLSRFAGGALFEMRQYVSALEAGYRAVCGIADGYARQERVTEATSGRLVRELTERQWSDGAALGYAAMALRMTGYTPSAAICVLEAMQEAMEANTLQEAAEAHQALLEGGGHG